MEPTSVEKEHTIGHDCDQHREASEIIVAAHKRTGASVSDLVCIALCILRTAVTEAKVSQESIDKGLDDFYSRRHLKTIGATVIAREV